MSNYSRFIKLYPVIKNALIRSKETFRVSVDGKVFVFNFANINAYDEVFEYETYIASQSSKSSLETLRKQGKKLGRPFGSKNKVTFAENAPEIKKLLEEGKTRVEIANTINCSLGTVNNLIKLIRSEK